jgi:hypothetical protein
VRSADPQRLLRIKGSSTLCCSESRATRGRWRRGRTEGRRGAVGMQMTAESPRMRVETAPTAKCSSHCGSCWNCYGLP